MGITITVSGEAERKHAAERAVLHLSVGFEGPERDDVLEQSARLHSELSAQLGYLHSPGTGPVLEWAGEQLRVWGQRPWSQTGEQLPVVHHSAASLSATFNDFVALSRWVGEIALLDGVTVNGVDWSLSDATRHEVESAVQRDAVAAAVKKAEIYAASLGFTGVIPEAISDPGLLGDDEHPLAKMAMRTSMGAADAGGDVTTLKPEEIRVSAAVHARFSAG
ncbi:SIMPL domain-containing protein [Microterricola viridarii]|uniref:SIMPL domain-containing protein n=1 Tax=Microterricola viridarii TaxID=412690 RepID=A0A1H1S4D7_9MICO|nr:SIMPL domain-containing protein [Microterricola viridarii]SDS42814.1 hypothetical protein SAMN04489834_1462 [Microterricola viridarii]